MINADADETSRTSLLQEYQSELKKQMERYKNGQAEYLYLLKRDEVKELSLTDEVDSIYSEITTMLFAAIKNNTVDVSSSVSKEQSQVYGLKLQPMPLPKFKGDIREYPRFKDD